MDQAAVYVRISSDVTGEGLGVERQEQDCRALAKRRGWKVAEVFVDNDISAYSGKPRPGYQALLEAIQSRRVAGVITWHPDRLHRSPRELEDFIDVIEETGCAIATVRAGEYDLTTPTGRMSARIVGAVARGESEHKADRVRRKLEQNARAGRHHGGMRPFGWREDRVSLEPAEAEVVRRAASMLLASFSMRSIARGLNESGATTALGKPWSDVGVRDMLVRPRNAGLRAYKGEVVGEGRWEPILDQETWQQVDRILRDPARVTTPGRDGRKHLLTGIATCAVCHGPLRVAKGKPYRRKDGTRVDIDIYRCMKGCVGRSVAKVDEHVAASIVGRLSLPDATSLLRDPEDPAAKEAAAEARRLHDRLEGAAADYADGKIERDQLALITKRLRPQIASLEARAAAGRPQAGALRDLVTTEDVAAKWLSLDVSQRRAIVAELVTVELGPSRTRGAAGFDYDSVLIAWA